MDESPTTRARGAAESAPPASLSAILRHPAASHLLALALLAAMLSGVFWHLTAQHEVLSPADLSYGSYPWIADPPPGYHGPGNQFQSDDAYLYYPRRYSFFEATGDSWWQDEYLSGARNTFSADFIGLDFYPVSIVYRVLPFPVANGFFHTGILFVAGASMYLLLWQLAMPWLARLYGALLFMLNGHFMVWLGAFFLPAQLGLLPLMIFGLERYHSSRKPPWLLIPVACLAVQAYLAYLPSIVITGVILTAYVAARLGPELWRRAYGRVTSQVALYAAVAVSGFSLAAYSLLPSIHSALNSDYQKDRELGLFHLPLEDAWTYLFPDYWGTARAWHGFNGNYPEWVAYASVTAAPLALVGFWSMRRHWLGWFSLIVLAFSASQVFGIPPLKELAHLPGLKQVAAGRWFVGINLVAAVMAPAGLAYLLKKDLQVREIRIVVGSLIGMLALAGICVLTLYADRHDTVLWSRMIEGRALIPTDPLEEIRSGSTHFHRQIIFLSAAVGLAGAALLARRKIPFVSAIVVVTYLDLFAFGYDYNATLERQDLYPVTPGIEYLQRDDDLFRVVPVASDGGVMVLPGYTANLFGLNVITGYDHYRVEEYLDFLAPIRSQNDQDITRLYGYVTVGANRQPLNHNILRLLNVKYVAASPAGLYFGLGGQVKNATAFPIYAERTQGQSLDAPAGTDAIEVLLATGGGPGPASPVVLRVKTAPDSPTELARVTLDGAEIADNSWYRVDLATAWPGGSLYVEVDAPDASEARPLLIWGIDQPTQETQRFDSGQPVEGTITYRVLDAPTEEFRLAYEGDDLWVYDVLDPLPRVWGVTGIEVLAGGDEVLERITEQSFDPGATIAVSGPDAGAAADAPGSAFAVEMTDYRPGHLVAQASLNEPGWVVVSERYDGGWRATVDGRSTPILHANGVLMAVPVPAGEHTIELQFQPAEYVWGRRISVITLIVLVSCGIAYFSYHFWRTRNRPPRSTLNL